MIAYGGPEVESWINFTVTTTTHFDLDDQPEPEQFLSILDECSDACREQQRAQPSE